jgi:group II intron reverse transcriptase/maturase
MRDAETVLSIIQARGKRGLPLERVYRLLFNRELYLRAYARLYPNKGALTRGATPETVDAMSVAKIDRLIDDVRHERHRWTPVRRVRIPKSNGKTRPLGVATWKDKLLQEVMRQILEAYYEPTFSDHTHGFRPGRGCHTALHEIQVTWTGTRWFIEGDLSSYFDTISHDRLMQTLAERIHDQRFLRLVRHLLQAGYLEARSLQPTLSGVPQGAILSPLLSNIYLARFDQYVETTLIPAHTRGITRRPNPAYQRVMRHIRVHKAAALPGVRALRKEARTIPKGDPHDPDYRRLRYIRYADDWLLGYDGTRAEAEQLKRTLQDWLHDNLHLTLSEEKTLITHATSTPARFLGYGLLNQQANHKRQVNGKIGLRVPYDVVQKKCAAYKRAGKPAHRAELLAESDYSIVARYQQEYRGFVQYYLLAHNVAALSEVHWVMETSLLRTLAAKHHSTTRKMRAKYKTTTRTPEGKTLRCLEVRVLRDNKPPLIARFGGISLTRQPLAILNDLPFVHKNRRTEILKRLLADTCELCGSHEQIEVHHIRKLADLMRRGRRAKPAWVEKMAAMRRKTLVVCRTCHDAILAGRPTRQPALE